MFDKALFELPGIKGVLAALGLLAALKAAAIIGLALSLALAIDNLWHGLPLHTQATPILAFFGCFFGKQLATTAEEALLARYAARQTTRLREMLLRRGLTGKAGWVRAQGTARVTTSALEGIDQVENYLKVILPKVMEAGIVIPATLVTTFVLDWPSGVILLAVLPIIVFYMMMLGRMAQDRAARQYGTYQRLSNHFVDTLRGLPVLKALGASKRHTTQVFQTSEDFREATVATLRVATLSSVVLDLLATLGVAAVAIILGFRLVVGSLSLFVGLAALILAPEYFAPLREFASDFHASLDGRNALADILALVGKSEGDEAAGTADGDGRGPATGVEAGVAEPGIQRKSEGLDGMATGVAAKGAWNAESRLSLEDVSFSYPPDCGEQEGHRALVDASFTVSGFKRVGIVGASGSGKSTLANLLGGFIEPEGGTICVDGTALSATGLAREDWQRQLLYIPQNPHIFHATLHESIAFYTPGASRADVERAAAVVGLAPLLAELPQGLDTVIGAGGRALSGGQAHRIALARALLDSSRRILIFDEPTAHLDIETELELKERMLPLMEGRLVFFATHRLHWLENMDYVLVLEDGRIVRQGTPAELGFADGAAPNAIAAEAKTEAVNGAAGGTATKSEDEVTAEAVVAPQGVTSASPRPSPATSPEGGAHAPSGVAGAASAAGAADTWVRPYFGRYRKTLLSALGLGIAAAAFAALLMFTSGYLISATAEATGSILFYYLPIAFVQVFGIGKPLLRYFERLHSHDWVFRMTSSLRVRLYKALERQALKPGQRSAGEVLGLVADDIGHIQNLYLRTVFPLVIAWALVLIAVVALAFADLAFAAAMLALLALATVGLPLLAHRANRRRIQRHKEMKSQLYDKLTDNLLGASDWVFSGRGDACVAAQLSAAEKAHALQEATERYTRLNGLAVSALMGGLACLILCWAALRFGAGAGTGGGTANWIAAFVLGFLALVETFAPLSTAALQEAVHRDSIERLNGFPHVDDSLPEDEGTCTTEGEEAEKGAAARGTAGALETLEGAATIEAPGTAASVEAADPIPRNIGIVTRGLAFTYPGTRKRVLDGIDLSIPYGQRIAILGRSGSGKSTLVSLIRGDVEPTAGTVELGGVATATLGDAAAAFIGMVQQDAYIFNAPLRDNLAIGKPNASDEEIWDALAHVGLANMARRLPQQLDTMMDEAGMRFSGGERQRVALVRVLLADTPIILLDEPTVGLDPQTEQDVLDTLMTATEGRTLIMITHHLQGVERFDRVVFVEDGHLELDGTPAELARTSKRYRQLLAFDRV